MKTKLPGVKLST